MDELTLLKELDTVRVSADAHRVLLHLIARGSLTEPVAVSYPALGLACFLNEPEALKAQALRKRAERAVRVLEAAQYLQVTQNQVGRGRATNLYRVFLTAQAPARITLTQEAKRTSVQETDERASRQTLSSLLRPSKRRPAPPHLIPKEPD